MQRSASSHQQVTQEHEGDEQEKMDEQEEGDEREKRDEQDKRDEQHKLEVKEVKLVDECLTRAWGRWELACASSGYLRILTYPHVSSRILTYPHVC